MRREILFRGMSISSKNWVYGHFAEDNNIYTITESSSRKTTHHIYSLSLGQFVGVKDGNGTKVFEGDQLLDEHGTVWTVAQSEDGWELTWKNGQGGSILVAAARMKVVGNIYQS